MTFSAGGFAYKIVLPHLSGFSDFCVRLFGADLGSFQLQVGGRGWVGGWSGREGWWAVCGWWQFEVVAVLPRAARVAPIQPASSKRLCP